MTRKLQICTRCGENPQLAPDSPGDYYNGLCGPCVAASRRCPRCREWIAVVDMRGSYCRACRSEYYRQWNQRGRRDPA
jgi:hypothetical protein